MQQQAYRLPAGSAQLFTWWSGRLERSYLFSVFFLRLRASILLLLHTSFALRSSCVPRSLLPKITVYWSKCFDLIQAQDYVLRLALGWVACRAASVMGLSGLQNDNTRGAAKLYGMNKIQLIKIKFVGAKKSNTEWGLEWYRVTVLQYWYMALTAVATVHIGNSVHWYSDSEDWNGIEWLYCSTGTWL